MQWSSGSSNKEWYVYDASGNRVLRRSQTSTGTTVTVYAFGLEEHTYTFDGSGNPTGQTQTYYYSLGGSLLGALEVNGSTSTTNYFLSDTLGSVLATINNTASSASVQGNQLYDPYGSSRYQSGSMTTSKGFTGQYNDNLTGLDYYGSRYYDPAAGVFLSADPVVGDLAGANPYEYVNANPETNTDPTGGMVACGAGCGGGSPMPPPPLAGGGSAAGGGGSTGLSYPPPSSCGQYTQSACLWAQYAAQSNWQATVQVKVDLRQLNAGGVLCHAGGTSLAVGPSLDGVSTLTMTSSLGGCYSSGGGGNSQVTGTATVYGASTTSLDGCASISCFDDGGGAAEKPTDGEAVSDSTGAGELAALMDDEGGNGGDGGRGGNLGDQSSDLSESSTDLNPPSKRHYYNNVNQKTLAKALNSVILPGVDVGADVASINNGEVELVNGTYTVNGRTYGVHEGTLYPISGDGIYQLDRGAFKALGVYRSFGITERAGLILDRMGMSEMARQIALDVYKTAEGL